ncbi:restriction endonuclease subunit S [Lachnospiraceae bacterium HCP1S3_B8]
MNRPKIRFKGYGDDWEQRKLDDIYGSIGNAFVGTASPYYVESGHFYLESNNIKDGQINHNTEVFINDEFYEKQKDKWLHTGDMVMVQSGHVGHAAVIPEELNNSAAHALIMFRNPKEEIEPYFLNYQYQTLKSKKKIENITTGNTIKHILASEMQQFEVDMPEMAEQKKIAEYFRGLDTLITLHQRKCDETKTLKKYMLQKMFPQDGKKVPEIRFKGFTDDWEQRKFSDVFTGLQNNTLSRSELNYESGTVKNVHYGDVLIKFGDYIDASKEELAFINDDSKVEKFKGSFLHNGDIVIADTAEDETVGKCTEIQGVDDIKLISGLHTIPCRPKEEYGAKFLGYYMNSSAYHAQLIPLMQGIKVTSISKSALQDTNMIIPKSVDEQTIIGEYFSNLDHLITLHQRKCDKLKEMKKYMLQNMFV